MAQPALPLLVQKNCLPKLTVAESAAIYKGPGHAAAQWAQNELLFSLVLKNKFKD
jgi:hypothetical protein